MRATWVNAEWTAARDVEAYVTRGFWRWKRVAHVARAPGESWRYLPSGDVVDARLGNWLDDRLWDARRQTIQLRLKSTVDRNWRTAEADVELPRAQLLRGGHE